MSVKVKDNTAEILADLQRKQLAFVAAAAESVRSAADVLAPVDKGNLRSSIKTEAYVQDGQAIGEVGPTAFYAVYQEYGTGKFAANGKGRKTPWVYLDEKTGDWVYTFGSPPQPFMQPGYDNASRGFRKLEEMLEL
jgi:HK97 gp10 family phage protein